VNDLEEGYAATRSRDRSLHRLTRRRSHRTGGHGFWVSTAPVAIGSQALIQIEVLELFAGFVDLPRFELGRNAMPVAIDVRRNFPSKHTRAEKLSVTDVASDGFDVAQGRIHGVITVDRTSDRHGFPAVNPLAKCALSH